MVKNYNKRKDIDQTKADKQIKVLVGLESELSSLYEQLSALKDKKYNLYNTKKRIMLSLSIENKNIEYRKALRELRLIIGELK